MLRWLAQVREEAETFCRALSPSDVADLPLYVVMRSELGDGFRSGEQIYGLTGPRTDVVCRDAIGARWRGRGPAMILDDAPLRRELLAWHGRRRRLGLGLVRQLVREWLLGVAVHEFGHVCEADSYRADLRYQVSPERAAAASQAHVTFMSEPGADTDYGKHPPYHGHEAAFIRMCIHLHRRAAEVDFLIPDAELFAHDRYHLSPLRAYREALGDEPRQFPTANLNLILKLPPPPAFAALWDADVRRFNESEKHNEHHVD